MRRAFTLIELMLASSISIIVAAALVVAFGSVWHMMKESSDELQLTLHARAVREQLLYRLDGEHAGLFYSKIRKGNAVEGVSQNSAVVSIEVISPQSQNGTSASSSAAELYQVDLSESSDCVLVRDAWPYDGNAFENVYLHEFIWNGATNVRMPSLFRMNLEYPGKPRRSSRNGAPYYEDHLIVFVDGKVGNI